MTAPVSAANFDTIHRAQGAVQVLLQVFGVRAGSGASMAIGKASM